MSASPSRITFGIVVPSAGSNVGSRVDQLVHSLSDRMGMSVQRRDAASYEALAGDVIGGRTDIAWIPPIVFMRLADNVSALGSIVREGNSTYEAALVVRGDSKIHTIDALRGLRAGWVDRWSASGYVLPRVNLSLLGVDPRTLFLSETFHGSHRSAINALTKGDCDVTGTYARADDSGSVTTGAWSEIEGANVRVLATFGAIPPDVIAIRSEIAAPIRDKALAAFRSVCAEDKSLIRDIFGGDDLREGVAPGYESLKVALDMATARGIFDKL